MSGSHCALSNVPTRVNGYSLRQNVLNDDFSSHNGNKNNSIECNRYSALHFISASYTLHYYHISYTKDRHQMNIVVLIVIEINHHLQI